MTDYVPADRDLLIAADSLLSALAHGRVAPTRSMSREDVDEAKRLSALLRTTSQRPALPTPARDEGRPSDLVLHGSGMRAGPRVPLNIHVQSPVCPNCGRSHFAGVYCP